ncbi:MAG TPA: PAS domain-containing protein [Verrucomicrobiae bacterium]
MMRDEQKEAQTRQYMRPVFDAIPLPMFIVDSDVRILDKNAAADQVLGFDPETALYQRGGDALNCIHAQAKGCGQSGPCRQCVIRTSVKQALEGQKTHRRLHQAELHHQEETVVIDLLVTTTPLMGGEVPQVLIILEDISELVTLRGLIPICAQCKKVRNDQQYWQSIEAYLETHTNLEFTHGYCPACFAEQMKAIKDFFHPNGT